MNNLKDVLILAITKIEEVTDLLYKQKNNEGYALLNSALINVTAAIDQLFAYKIENNSLNIDENKLISNLTEAMHAMEEKDTVLLADILQYEIVEQFKTIVKIL